MMLGQQPEILDGPGCLGLEELELDGAPVRFDDGVPAPGALRAVRDFGVHVGWATGGSRCGGENHRRNGETGQASKHHAP